MMLDYSAATGIGLTVGMGELVSRYRDAPTASLRTAPALFYIALNGAAAAAALGALILLGWPQESTTSPIAPRVLRIMAAGFGAMAVFRSSLFIARVGDQDVPIGPGAFLQIVLGAADRAVDRIRASARSEIVRLAMAGVEFKAAYAALPAFCLALMQNLSTEDQQSLARQIQAIDQSPNMDPEVKSLALGLALMNVVGDGVLKSAVKSLNAQIKSAVVIDIVGSSSPISVGKSATLKAEAKDVLGNIIVGKSVTWGTSDPSVATVDALGIVRAIAQGAAVISATTAAVTGTFQVSVG